MAASAVPGLNLSPVPKSHFLGQTHRINIIFLSPRRRLSSPTTSPTAKFDPFEILGGRGLCGGEKGIRKELQRTVSQEPSSSDEGLLQEKSQASASETVPGDGFDKELMGLTGGFPGGEKGLKKFIEENPPAPKKPPAGLLGLGQGLIKKPRPPELPLLLPGMIAIVKNPNSPYHMYCGIVQRITDGRAAVLFEGGVWDRLITFRLEELERREKGPPMASPRSAVLESIVQKDSS